MSVAEGGESGASGTAPAPSDAAPDPLVDVARGGRLAASTPTPALPGGPTLAVSGGPTSASPGEPARAQVHAGFGPTALATPANAVTVARLAVAPVVVVMVAVSGATWAAFVLAFVVGVTDGLDGWLARRQGPTRSGAFIDPLADKVVVVGLLAAVAARGEVTWVPPSRPAGRPPGTGPRSPPSAPRPPRRPRRAPRGARQPAAGRTARWRRPAPASSPSPAGGQEPTRRVGRRRIDRRSSSAPEPRSPGRGPMSLPRAPRRQRAARPRRPCRPAGR